MRAALIVGLSVSSAAAGPTRLATVSGETATLVEAGASAKVIATIKLPASAHDLVWIDRDPVVLLDGGKVGTITPKGFVAISTPPNSTFVLPRPNDGVQKLDTPQWRLIGSTTDELWLGRCDWGFFPDGMTVCENWVWARLGGSARLTSRASPADSIPRWDGWTTTKPAPGIAITFAPRHGNGLSDTAETMTCRAGATTTTFPDEQYTWTEHDTLRWISQAPPIFVVDSLANGYQGIVEPTVFEGCTPSSRFSGGVTGYTGPTSLFVLASHTASTLRRDGKELLALPGATFVAFEPSPMPQATDAFALLEREIAGDASMFAPDATVLTPAPIVGAPKLAKHANARIERFATEALGDAMWLAAELQLDGKSVRTLQLIDHGRVIVATFAPVKSLAPGGTAPTIAASTSPGPLANFAASPTTAAKAAYNGTTVFGTDASEHAVGDSEDAQALLASWSTLALTLDPKVREVHTATYGYAIATVVLGKSRMLALVIGKPDKTGGWQLVAMHYLGL